MKNHAIVVTSLVATLTVACRPAEKGAEVARTATVTRASGVELAAGDRCSVRVRNEARGGFSCRLEIVCGGIPLFGGRIPGGYARCAARGGRWVSAYDDELPARDGDPAISVDFVGGRLWVDTGRAQVVARLDPVASVVASSDRR
ncbi:MAG: hypothetical protein JNK05_30055 [Myxococcales bacterium]|nr:hypothetical protein [Myxococcales bacterium]